MGREGAKLRLPVGLLVLGILLAIVICLATGVIPGTLPRNRTPVVPPTAFSTGPVAETPTDAGPSPTQVDATCWVPSPAGTDPLPFWTPAAGESGEPRSPLTAQDLQAYLTVMGIGEICVPPELGGLFLSVDWDEAEIDAVTGRMISLGFPALYEGSGWGRGYLVYATYDFAAGTEYDTFARPEDLILVQGSSADVDPIEADGVRGFVRFQRGLCYGSCIVHRVIVFPFEEHYIAIVQALGEIEGEEDWETLLAQLRAGRFPATWDRPLPAIDALARSLRFVAVPPGEG